MSSEPLACLVCGAPHAAHGSRCAECGAELVRFDSSASERHRWSTRTFAVLLLAYALGVGVFVVLLPFVLKAYDPQGLPGLGLAALLFVVGGVVAGRFAGPRAYLEPALASALVSGVLVPYVAVTADVRAAPVPYYVAAAVLGVMAASLASFLAERPAAHP